VQKRALIVDDSKSARVVLGKILEKYEIVVDSAESAADALTRLGDERPDVIFMDHLMPEMDGFQAVQAIKNDPRTASIPILMYTSQGGDLYLSQARALGAAGVLPKQLGLAEVAKVLEQLHLLPARRSADLQEMQPGLMLDGTPPAGAEQTEPAPTPVAVPTPALDAAALRAAVEPLFSQQSAELRRFLLATIDGLAARLRAEAVSAVPSPLPVAEVATVRRIPPALVFVTLASLLGAAAGAYYGWSARTALKAAETRIATLEAAAAQAREPAAPAASPVQAEPAVEQPAAVNRRQTERYAYGEVPLAGARLAALRDLVTDVERRGAAGTIRITSFAADFCLTGNPGEGYVPAPDDMPATHCDVLGNPADDALRGSQRASSEFVDYLATLGRGQHGALTAVVQHVSHAKNVAFPVAAEATAAVWNAAAVANQVVELRFEPASAPP
jgi:CheY-like chemotaxis protein